jgi:predicted PurR-regulated permease PerM
METASFSEKSLPNNNMTLAIIAAVLGLCSPCCIGLILGIIAIVLSNQVKTKFERGNLAEAISSAKNSKILSFIAIGLLVLNLIFLLSFGGVATYQEILENYNFTQ